MRPFIRGLFALSLAFGVQAAETRPVVARPNILLILADDLGYQDLGCQGSPDLRTPHIDSIARNGVRFTSGYVSSAMCSPSRAGLLTGRSQSRFGHEINYESDPEGVKGLPLTEVTFADRMKALGYRTGIVGKWHLGETHPQRHPQRRGFDEFFGFLSGGHQYFCENLRPELTPEDRAWNYFSYLERNGVPEKTSGYLTDVLGKECVDFIHRHRERPWFLYASFNAPHGPLQATPPYLDRFPHIQNERRRTYAAMISALDDAVGAMLGRLRADGLEERTLVIFLSDNGGPVEPRHPAVNLPFSGEKGTFLEGGIRVPFLMQFKGVWPAGKIYDRPISSLDLLPTALALAGASARPEWELDGVNLLPFLSGEKTGDPHERLLWRMTERRIWAIREGDMKITVTRLWNKEKTPMGAPPKLYDLARDPTESTDLASVKPEVFERMRAAYDAWAATLPAPLWGTDAAEGVKKAQDRPKD